MTSTDLISQMLSKSFYNYDIDGEISLSQTHASYIVLTGQFAYKIKKTVNFGFLDYSTLNKRKFYCEEELRLNKKGAEALYLEVLPIYNDHGVYSFEANGEVVEYCIKMHQFDQKKLFSNMLKSGKLLEKDVKNLGEVVAEYHIAALRSEQIESYGLISEVRKAFDENYQQTEKYIGIAISQDDFNTIKESTDRFFKLNQDLFIKRIRLKKIIECHGDLHLGNICYWKNKIQLFDCIEFNDSFRFADAMYDLAYAYMDLDFFDKAKLERLYVKTYIDITKDKDGLKILPIYLVRQSYVRAKIACFMLDSEEISSDKKANYLHDAKKYYNLALKYSQNYQINI